MKIAVVCMDHTCAVLGEPKLVQADVASWEVDTSDMQCPLQPSVSYETDGPFCHTTWVAQELV